MDRKNKIATFLFCLLLAAGFYLYFGFYNQSQIHVGDVYTEIEITSEVLISSFIEDEEFANFTYKEKIIEVDGIIKEINFLNNRNTIVLQSNNSSSSILCDMESDQIEFIQELRQGQKIKLKGICKGFLKDVILLNCILINKKINE